MKSVVLPLFEHFWCLVVTRAEFGFGHIVFDFFGGAKICQLQSVCKHTVEEVGRFDVSVGYFVLVELAEGADGIYEKLLGPQLSVIPEIVIFFFYEFIEVLPFDLLNHEVVGFLVFEVLIELENVRVVDLHAVDFKLVI